MPDINNKNIKIEEVKADLSIFVPQQLTEKEFNVVNGKVIMAINEGAPDPGVVFAIMYRHFEENKFAVAEIKKYKDTYWYWLVRIGWSIISKMQDKVFVEFVSRTLPYAIAQFVPAKFKVVDFLEAKTPEVIKKLYDQIKQKIMLVDYPIAFNNFGEKNTLSAVIKQIQSTGDKADMSRFELFAGIQKAFFGGETSGEGNIVETNAVQEFVDLLSFFVKNVSAQDYVNEYYLTSINDHEYDKLDEESLSLLGANLIAEAAELENEADMEEPTEAPKNKIEKNEVEDVINFSDEIAKNKQNFSKWIEDPATLRSLLTWLKEIEDKVEARKKLEDLLQKELGQNALADIETALAIVNLDEFLNRNNYPGDDLVHYDEKAGEFRWHLNT